LTCSVLTKRSYPSVPEPVIERFATVPTKLNFRKLFRWPEETVPHLDERRA